MKQIIKLLIITFIIYASASASVLAKDITLNVALSDINAIIIPTTARFNIFTKDGVWLENDCFNVSKDTENASVTFTVPDTENIFRIVSTVGLTDITYNDVIYKPGEEAILDFSACDSATISATPLFLPPTGLIADKLTLYFDVLNLGTPIESDARFNLFNENGEWLANDAVHITNGGEIKELVFNIGEYYTGTKFYVTPTVGMTSVNYNGTEYKPEESIEIETYAYKNEDGQIIKGDFFHFNLTPINKYPELVPDHKFKKQATEFINASGIDSRTNYLIWVSKKDFTLSVFLGKAGEWQFVNAFDCSIGAPGTPTITGVFEYFQYQERWNYDTYYVGPIMRFAPKGYALHSTLLRYNGADADARLRKRISHGCVRLAPPSINWLVEYIPLNTRVYITE